MKLIGMLHYRRKPHNVKMAYTYASVSKMDGIDFVYFSYRAVDFSRQKIYGWIFKDGNWIQQEVVFRSTIINIRCSKDKRTIDYPESFKTQDSFYKPFRWKQNESF